ncbi:hypothetical protein FRC07_009499 [Ceratobasidium sp. 392]|nr:hypothetical protein FRC07_009499 [Ceratobasidium sp. 392]
MATLSEGSSTNEGFRTGGDVTLRSLDGVEFSVHSLFLSVASPVLAHMFCAGKKEAVVDVAETSEMLSFMLKFIYPFPPPPIASLELLGKGLHVADKYGLEGMKGRLRKELSVRGSPISVFGDPLRALAFATVHDLADEAALAASVAAESRDFHKTESLVELAQTIPAIAPIVKMIGTPCARASILIDVLFRPPEWQIRWAYWVFQELNTRKISKCDEVFTIRFWIVTMHKGEIPVPGSPCDCYNHIPRYPSQFESWTSTVRESLVDRLKSLEPLGTVD